MYHYDRSLDKIFFDKIASSRKYILIYRCDFAIAPTIRMNTVLFVQNNMPLNYKNRYSFPNLFKISHQNTLQELLHMIFLELDEF